MDTKVIGVVYNASRATFDGRDCWVASLCLETGKTLCSHYIGQNVQEVDDPAKGKRWLRTQAKRRGLKLVRIDVEDKP